MEVTLIKLQKINFKQQNKHIPTKLTEKQFDEFVFPHLSIGRRGPRCGHKHFQGEKIVVIVDQNVNVIAPYVTAPGNKNECPLLAPAIEGLKKISRNINANILGSISSWDGVYDSKDKRIFRKDIFQKRFQTIERLFAWEDKFKRLLLRFERKSENHFGMKLIAYAMINLRHFCKA
ncbi:MAG: hypothetical protein ACD_45C00226G0002 [uncultured bacterium]|nr:MAG: hypothetical protein ACD_45C00226G0002 [uncultured bacterium]